VQEFVQSDFHFCKFYILCGNDTGTVSLENRTDEEGFLVDARFFSQSDLRHIDVRPDILKDLFWSDLQAGFPQTRYLGLQRTE
jgi:hypothetical protein